MKLFKLLAKVVIVVLAMATFIAVGFADAIPENSIWFYMTAIIASLLIQIFIGCVSGIFDDAIEAMKDEEDE